MNKTIFLIRNVVPSAYGGGESYQLELAKVLKNNDYNPIIVSSSLKLLENAKRNKIMSIKAPYCRMQNWSSWRNLLLPIYAIWQIGLYFWYKKQIAKYKPLALNIQSRDDMIAATLVGKKFGLKIFWTDHADFRNWVMQNIKVKYKNFIGKYILKISHIPQKIIMISDYEYQYFCRAVQKLDNLTIIKNGVIDQKKQYDTIIPKQKSFCYIGRMVDEKGIKEAIKAFAVVQKTHPESEFHLYGEGNDAKKYLLQAQNIPNIHFHGYTNEPLKSIAMSSVVVLPSYHEGLNLSLIEAAMMQKTIIATNVDGNPEIVINNKTGLLVPPKNSQQLSKAMIDLLNNPEKSSQLAHNAREFYQTNFDFEKTIKKEFIPLLEN